MVLWYVPVAQHSKRLESQMNYLSVFECLILLVSFPVMISFCRRNTCCKIFVFISKLVEYIKISQKAVTTFLPIDAKNGGHFGLHNSLSEIYLNRSILR